MAPDGASSSANTYMRTVWIVKHWRYYFHRSRVACFREDQWKFVKDYGCRQIFRFWNVQRAICNESDDPRIDAQLKPIIWRRCASLHWSHYVWFKVVNWTVQVWLLLQIASVPWWRNVRKNLSLTSHYARHTCTTVETVRSGSRLDLI